MFAFLYIGKQVGIIANKRIAVVSCVKKLLLEKNIRSFLIIF